MTGPLRGAIAAAVTPLAERGQRLDESAVGPMLAFLARAGLDGALIGGTTGEGILLRPEERRRLAEVALRARPPGFAIAIHAGAQTTADTVELAAHARDQGADAVVVMAPPTFPLDDREVLAHLERAAAACAPVPFYAYEFAARSGYAISPVVIERLRDRAPNLAGLKVSDPSLEAIETYLVPGLDVFVGSEPLVLAGLERGASGAVSGLAAAWPNVVAALVRDRSPLAHDLAVRLRRHLAHTPFHAALKTVLVARGVLACGDVRAPLRDLEPEERERVLDLDVEVGEALAQSTWASRQAP
ncbi:MAG: hypothetical protein KatS3mg013_1535 [Actinomycetota bacterium]|jgi:dihydrodipicolinate synthase/N-acetylneuraminate lyase|nr:MAG: hypothetical protein KatS3mg013_1535 [Actinomycetota bacterium]